MQKSIHNRYTLTDAQYRELKEYVAKKPNLYLLTKLIDLEKRGYVTIRPYQRMLTALKKYRREKHLAYVTSPQSETYWAS